MGNETTDHDDFFDEAPTAVMLRVRAPAEPEGDVIFEVDLDPATFVPMATRYPEDL